MLNTFILFFVFDMLYTDIHITDYTVIKVY